MGEAKRIQVRPIPADMAKRIIRRYHYSGKTDPRSQLHFGVFLDGRCGGAMQLGPPIDKRKVLSTVRDSKWNGLLDLHRVAFADWLPRNSESRALSVMIRLIKKHYPWIEWIQSYADACQCGDGAIYRASGFRLIGIKTNNSMYRLPDGEVACKIVFEPGFGSGSNKTSSKSIKARYGKTGSETAGQFLKRIGATPLKGYQLRYIIMLNGEWDRLTVPVIPFSEIESRGIKMYRGQSVGGVDGDTPAIQVGEDGSSPIPTLQSEEVE